MPDPIRSYYEAALTGLRFIDSRKPSNRRFGENARALWSEFRGDLTDSDRIDLMLRDADVQWPGAFGAQTVFQSPGVADDDAFGPDWEALDSVDAADVLRSIERAAAAADMIGALSSVAAAWGVVFTPFETPAIGASDHFVVAGPSAVAALMKGFAEGRDLDWVDQVTCVASPAAHRQIAAIAGGFLNIPKRARVVAAAGGLTSRLGTKLVVSPDADPADAAAAGAATRGK